jgi:hypothetical protein
MRQPVWHACVQPTPAGGPGALPPASLPMRARPAPPHHEARGGVRRRRLVALGARVVGRGRGGSTGRGVQAREARGDDLGGGGRGRGVLGRRGRPPARAGRRAPAAAGPWRCPATCAPRCSPHLHRQLQLLVGAAAAGGEARGEAAGVEAVPARAERRLAQQLLSERARGRWRRVSGGGGRALRKRRPLAETVCRGGRRAGGRPCRRRPLLHHGMPLAAHAAPAAQPPPAHIPPGGCRRRRRPRPGRRRPCLQPGRPRARPLRRAFKRAARWGPRRAQGRAVRGGRAAPVVARTGPLQGASLPRRECQQL